MGRDTHSQRAVRRDWHTCGQRGARGPAAPTAAQDRRDEAVCCGRTRRLPNTDGGETASGPNWTDGLRRPRWWRRRTLVAETDAGGWDGRWWLRQTLVAGTDAGGGDGRWWRRRPLVAETAAGG